MGLEKQVGKDWMASLGLTEEEESQVTWSRDETCSDLCFKKITLVTVWGMIWKGQGWRQRAEVIIIVKTLTFLEKHRISSLEEKKDKIHKILDKILFPLESSTPKRSFLWVAFLFGIEHVKEIYVHIIFWLQKQSILIVKISNNSEIFNSESKSPAQSPLHPPFKVTAVTSKIPFSQWEILLLPKDLKRQISKGNAMLGFPEE